MLAAWVFLDNSADELAGSFARFGGASDKTMSARSLLSCAVLLLSPEGLLAALTKSVSEELLQASCC